MATAKPVAAAKVGTMSSPLIGLPSLVNRSFQVVGFELPSNDVAAPPSASPSAPWTLRNASQSIAVSKPGGFTEAALAASPSDGMPVPVGIVFCAGAGMVPAAPAGLPG